MDQPRDAFDDLIEFLFSTNTMPGEMAEPSSEVWQASGPERMRAVLLGHIGVEVIEIPRSRAYRAIADIVGDPMPERVQYVPDMLIWLGENSRYTSECNDGATGIACELIADAATGTYATTPHGRAHAERLAATPDFIPHIHGRAILTGIADSGEPGPLSEASRRWIGTILDQTVGTALRLQAQAVVDIATRQLGLRGPHPGSENPDRPGAAGEN